MRLELKFEVKNNVLPKDNKRIWVSFLKNVLSNCAEGKYYDRYYNGTSPKDFSFSIVLPHPKFVGEKIELDSNTVRMIFSASDKGNTGLIFYSAFLEAKNKSFPLPSGNSMTLKAVRYQKEQSIQSNSAVFRTVVGGGLVVREHDAQTNKDKFYTSEEDGFIDAMCRVIKNELLYAKFPEYLINDVSVNVISFKKVLVKQYGVYVDANVGVFQVNAHPEILQYLYQAGMGSKRSMGYGLLDVVNTEEWKGGGLCDYKAR